MCGWGMWLVHVYLKGNVERGREGDEKASCLDG